MSDPSKDTSIENGKGTRSKPKKVNRDSDDQKQPLFLRKTFHMITTCPQDIACWSDNGDSFIIKDTSRLTNEIIPTFFKHNKMTSFVRQLNFYGFKKVRSEFNHVSWSEFKHPYFRRGDSESLSKIKKCSDVENELDVDESYTNTSYAAEMINSLSSSQHLPYLNDHHSPVIKSSIQGISHNTHTNTQQQQQQHIKNHSLSTIHSTAIKSTMDTLSLPPSLPLLNNLHTTTTTSSSTNSYHRHLSSVPDIYNIPTHQPNHHTTPTSISGWNTTTTTAKNAINSSHTNNNSRGRYDSHEYDNISYGSYHPLYNLNSPLSSPQIHTNHILSTCTHDNNSYSSQYNTHHHPHHHHQQQQSNDDHIMNTNYTHKNTMSTNNTRNTDNSMGNIYNIQTTSSNSSSNLNKPIDSTYSSPTTTSYFLSSNDDDHRLMQEKQIQLQTEIKKLQSKLSILQQALYECYDNELCCHPANNPVDILMTLPSASVEDIMSKLPTVPISSKSHKSNDNTTTTTNTTTNKHVTNNDIHITSEILPNNKVIIKTSTNFTDSVSHSDHYKESEYPLKNDEISGENRIPKKRKYENHITDESCQCNNTIQSTHTCSEGSSLDSNNTILDISTNYSPSIFEHKNDHITHGNTSNTTTTNNNNNNNNHNHNMSSLSMVHLSSSSSSSSISPTKSETLLKKLVTDEIKSKCCVSDTCITLMGITNCKAPISYSTTTNNNTITTNDSTKNSSSSSDNNNNSSSSSSECSCSNICNNNSSNCTTNLSADSQVHVQQQESESCTSEKKLCSKLVNLLDINDMTTLIHNLQPSLQIEFFKQLAHRIGSDMTQTQTQFNIYHNHHINTNTMTTEKSGHNETINYIERYI